MKDIQNLLHQVSIISKKNNEFLEKTGGRFNIFRITGVDHYEVIHSSILAELLNPNGSHGLREKFLDLFFIKFYIKEELKSFDRVNAMIKTESPIVGGRIDILIQDNNKRAIIIENKIYASDQEEQLKRYNDYAKEHFVNGYIILYLTLFGTSASEQSATGVDYTPISYDKTIIQWLEECVNAASRYPLVRETINQYINHLKLLTNQDMDKLNQNEVVGFLSKPENILAAIKISENIFQAKMEVVRCMADAISKKFSLNFLVTPDGKSIHFFKEGWKLGSSICFAEDKGNTYYAIKTAEAREGKAIPQKRIETLFELKENVWDPYGYGYVLKEHWSNNSQYYEKMVVGKLVHDTIEHYLKNVLDYLKNDPEIEKLL